MNTETIAIIQARMGSRRLPGKVLADLNGRAVLAWVVRAARAIRGVGTIAVATSLDPEDDAIAAWCDAHRVGVVRGDSSDVLARFNSVLDQFPNVDAVMRLTADCPFLDPAVCDQVLELFRAEECAYASNVHPPTWPDGLDCEVVSADALRSACKEAVRASEREHVTSYISADAARFKARTLVCPIANISGHRWTLDTEADLAFLRRVAAAIGDDDRAPAFTEILGALRRDRPLNDESRRSVRDGSYSADIAAEARPAHRGYRRSQEKLARALKSIPLGSQTFSKSHLQFPAGTAPLFASRGRSGRIWDVDGNEYVDLMCGLLSVNLGYNDPDVDAAVREQLTRGVTFSLNTELEWRAAELIVDMVPSAEMVRFAKNGSDVTAAAVRLARAVTGRDRVAFCGYHGWQDWYVGGTSMNKGVPQAVRSLTHYVPYNDIAALAQELDRHRGEFACVILEPLSGDGPAASYLADLCAVTRSHGALVVFDEVISGFRIAAGGAQDYFKVRPDLTTLGKGLANGFPLSALAGSAAYMNQVSEIFFSGTFGGETLSLAASVAVLEKIKREPVIERLWTTGKRMAAIARQIVTQNRLDEVVTLKGLAPWITLNFREHPSADADMIYSFFVREMARNGVLTQGSHNVCYAHGEEDIAWVEAAYDATLSALADRLKSNSLARAMEGQVVRPLFKIRPNRS